MSELQDFFEADQQLNRIIRDEIDKAGTILEADLMERVCARVAVNSALAETLARRQLYRDCARAFAAKEQREAHQ